MAESRLVRQAQAGDEQAFVQIFETYVDRIYRFTLTRVSDPPLAEDLTSQTFIKAWSRLDQFHERGLPFSAWLFRIARNLTIDHYRGAKEVEPLDSLADSLHDPTASPETQVEIALENERLQVALNRLTPDQREVLVLKFLEGFSTAEVAQILNKNEGAVRALQMRGLQALAEHISLEDKHDSA